MSRPSGMLSETVDARRAAAIRAAPVLPRFTFLAVGIGCWVLVGFLGREVFLFWDDYAFIGQAARMPLDIGYLSSDLFGHFSPLLRLANKLILQLYPAHPSLLLIGLWLTAGLVQLSIFVLLRVLFGRTYWALVGATVLSTSLTLLPLTIWWTAGLNIMPAMAGSALCLAGAVAHAQGRSAWWGALAIAGYLLAVLDWELTMISAGYALLWIVLFRTRITTERLLPLLFRMWWVWAALVAIGLATLVNYRLNYYVAGLPASLADYFRGLAVSLFGTVLPSILGFHDPDTSWFATLGTVLAIVVVSGLIGYSTMLRVGAWRGWLFAGAGWIVPSAALVINRVGVHGTWVATLPFYFFLPSVLLMIGVLAALTSPGRQFDEPSEQLQHFPASRWIRLASRISVAVVVCAWTYSAGPSARVITTFSAQINDVQPPTGQFVEELRGSAAAIEAEIGRFSVLNSDVPFSLVPPAYGPYNRADWVAQLNGIKLNFDQVDMPLYAVSDGGGLVPATVEWSAELSVSTGSESGLMISNPVNLRTDSARGACFQVVDGSTSIIWDLPRPVAGDRLVAQARVTVDQPTTERLVVLATDNQEQTQANYDAKTWQPDQAGLLDTIGEKSITALSFDSMTPGSTVCLSDLAVGNAIVE